MAKVSDGELIGLIEGALDRYVSAPNIDVANVRHAVAESIARTLHDAGTTVIREERDRLPANAAAVVALARLRQTVAA